MALLTRKEFARACGMEQNSVAVYLKREEIILEEGFVDTEHPKNKMFLEKRIAKGKVPMPTVQTDYVGGQVVVSENRGQPRTDDGIPDYAESERKVKYFDALKREKEVEKLQLDIQKKRGEVIPSELIPPVILQHNQSIITAMKNEFDEWLRNHAKKYDLGTNEISEIRTQAVGWINNGMTKATAMSVRAVENIVRDYQEKRGVGERI